MTENEAIEYMENEVRCIKQASHCDRDCLKCGLVKEEQPLLESFAVAIQALEEIQQYRVYIEIFENHFCKEALELLSDKEEFGKWLERGKWIAKRCDEVNRELVEYQTIGTIEECRTAVERMKPKKATNIVMAKDRKICVVRMGKCPCCGSIVAEGNFTCGDCFQVLDWSE